MAVMVDTDRLLSISDANSRGVSRLATDAENGVYHVLMRNSRPVAAVVPISTLERLQELEHLEADLRLLAVTLTRMLGDTGNRTTFDDVLARFDLDEDDLVTPDGA